MYLKNLLARYVDHSLVIFINVNFMKVSFISHLNLKYITNYEGQTTVSTLIAVVAAVGTYAYIIYISYQTYKFYKLLKEHKNNSLK